MPYKVGGIEYNGEIICAWCSDCGGFVNGNHKYCPYEGTKFEDLSKEEIKKREAEKKQHNSEKEMEERRKNYGKIS